MKRILLSAILAMGIHAYLLWADFGWIGKKPYLKPKPQRLTLTLVSRPIPKAEPAPKPLKPASMSTPETAPEATPPPKREPKAKSKPIPKPESKAESKPAPKPKPEPEPEIEPARPPAPEITTAAPVPEKPKPPQVMTAPDPLPYSRTEPATGGEKPDVPASVPEPEPRPGTVPKTDEQEQPDSAEPVEASAASTVIREAKPRYRDNPPPRYPKLARKRGYQGTVILDVFIDKNGRVADMKVFSSSGYTVLDKAAQATVESWLFEPGMKGEEKVEMWVKIPVRFQLK